DRQVSLPRPEPQVGLPDGSQPARWIRPVTGSADSLATSAEATPAVRGQVAHRGERGHPLPDRLVLPRRITMIAPEVLERVRNLGGTHLNQLATMAELKEYPAGAEIFRQREDSPYFYFVLDGEVALDIQVSDREAVEIHRAGPGEFFGWSPALGRHAMTGTG